MIPVVGVFQSRSQAEQAIERLQQSGVDREHISYLTPGSGPDPDAVSGSEQPGMGATMGGVVGGALGAAGGLSVGTALAALLVPGVGPVLAGGLLGAGLLGAGGAAGGAAAGDAIEDKVSGVPRDELFVYEDALRHGRSVVLAETSGDDQAAAARATLTASGAETVDAAREQWWIGLRSAEKESYLADGGDFQSDEPEYRKGFEAAQSHALRGQSYEQAKGYLARRYEISAAHPAFRKGFERGRRHCETLRNQISYSGGFGRP